MILGLFKGLLGLVLSIARYIEVKQLLDAGEAKANVKTLEAINDNAQKAKANRITASNNPDLIKRLLAKYKKNPDK